MTKNRLLLLIVFTGMVNCLQAQSGCPGCNIDLPSLPADTLYLAPAPDGEAGVYYEEDIGFRLPKTTTPVHEIDPSTPAGLDINSIEIISLVGLPPGLQWQANKTSFKPSDDPDGCVRFCGVPLQPGLYEIQVFVKAQVLVVTQATSFSFPLYIAPSTSVNAGFSMTNNSGCGAVTVSFENNVPSGGQSGFSYVWDFGNGFQSLKENPPAVTYDQPGIYEVKYQAVVDTHPYLLTTVHVLDVGCGDVSIPPIFNGAPDLYLKIKDPNGEVILKTNPVNNAPVPFAFTINLPLVEGNYELEVRDEDTFGSESCGTVNFNRTTTGILASGSLEVALDIFHPVDTIRTIDTVRVFPVPPSPTIDPGPLVRVCMGEQALLIASYDENLQWYRDTTLLFGETFPELLTSNPGSYRVEYTSDDGCKVSSEPTQVDLIPLPAPPAFHFDKNRLILNEPNLLPPSFTLQWFIDGDSIPDATDSRLCMTEPGTHLYTLVVTDLTTGCSRDFSLGATFQPEFDCLTPTAEAHAGMFSVHLWPNPVSSELSIVFHTPVALPVSFGIFDTTGRLHAFRNEQAQPGENFLLWSIEDLPSGLYLLNVQSPEGTYIEKLVKR